MPEKERFEKIVFEKESSRTQVKIKTHRVYFDGYIYDDVLKISDAQIINYLKNALRLKADSLIRIFDKSENEYLLKIVEIQNKCIILEKIETLSNCKNENLKKNKSKKNQFVAGICILKPEKMRESVDIATQMGVGIIQPIISDRCQNFGLNMDKIKAWSIEASEQSERLSVPVINSPVKLVDFVKNANDKIIVANEHFGINIKDFFKKVFFSSDFLPSAPQNPSLDFSSKSIHSSDFSLECVGNFPSNYDSEAFLKTPPYYISDYFSSSHQPCSSSPSEIQDSKNPEPLEFCACIVGPEGGFSIEDLATLNSDKIINVNLGSRILKSHVALAKILSFFCD